MRYRYVQQRSNIKFCTELGKLSPEKKHGAFDMKLKGTTEFAMETADITTSHGSSHVETTNEDSDHDFLRYGALLTL
jgi:hypothetical protein